MLVNLPGTAEWIKQKLVNATADFSEPEQKDADGKNGTGPVAYLIDGKDEFKWKDVTLRFKRDREGHVESFTADSGRVRNLLFVKRRL